MNINKNMQVALRWVHTIYGFAHSVWIPVFISLEVDSVEFETQRDTENKKREKEKPCRGILNTALFTCSRKNCPKCSTFPFSIQYIRNVVHVSFCSSIAFSANIFLRIVRKVELLCSVKSEYHWIWKMKKISQLIQIWFNSIGNENLLFDWIVFSTLCQLNVLLCGFDVVRFGLV